MINLELCQEMPSSSNLKRIVVVGGGAGGLELVTALGKTLGRKKLAHISLSDRNPTHIWKPLLHEVATGALNVGEDEVNYFTHACQSGYRFNFGSMNGLDRERKVIKIAKIKDLEGNIVSGPREIKYDTLIFAVGAQTNSFGTPGVEEYCQTLDTPREAEKLRKRFLGHALAVAFGKFPKIRIGIVGAGATGVELAAEVHHTMTEIRSYGATIKQDQIEMTIIEAGSSILAVMLPQFAEYSHQELVKKGFDIRLNCGIKEVTEKGFLLSDGSFLEKDIKIWTAGIKAPEWLQGVDLEVDKLNRIKVNKFLQSVDDPSIYAIGDCALTKDIYDPSKFLPASAQCAHQQAEWLAQKLLNDFKGKPTTKPFIYKSQGMLVSLGNTTAVGSVTGLVTNLDHKFQGRSAKFLYSTLYRMHQAAIYGWLKAGFIWLGDRLRSVTLPGVKLH